MIRVITVSREYGSGGAIIGKIVADRLGWKCVDDPVVTELARAANIDPNLAARYDECIDPWFHRMVKAVWRGGYEGVVSGSDLFDADAMAELWHRAIVEAAAIGECVIVGRGGQCLLQDRDDTFHVSVYGPWNVKAEVLRTRVPAGTDIEAVARDVDARRAAYIRRYFDADWTDRHLYHLMICSAIGFETAATAILCACDLQ
jgi:cytidylate kinase